jgi:Uma2 family endonuclease
MPPPTVEHQIISSQLIAWFASRGWPPEQVLAAVGVRTEKQQRYGGRIPDLVVWSARPTGRIWVPGKTALLVIEIASTSTASISRTIKRDEYAVSGIPRYWMVGQDPANTVAMLELDGDAYHQVATHPLAWLLNTDPADYLTD